MNRRAYLGTAGASLVGLAAGCLGDEEDDLLDDEDEDGEE